MIVNKKILSFILPVVVGIVTININCTQTETPSDKKISAIIAPHHDLVKEKRDELFEKVANSESNKPKTIILVSPNHFNTGSADIITTDKTWQLQNANIFSDKEKIKTLVDGGLVTNQEPAFSREHGITNLLDPINKYFPQAKIIPIIFRQSITDREKVDKLANQLHQLCGDNCLLVASVDFSHYQPGALAEIHDDLSIRALTNLDEDLIWQAEVDSEQSLYLAMKWSKLNGTENFHLEENTNSGKIANERDTETTSYVFGWYEKDPSTPLRSAQDDTEYSITFTIGGDMMFDRMIDYRFPGNNLVDVVSNLAERFFWGTDISMVNLEGPISSDPIKPDIRSNNLVFNFPPKTTDVLKWLHINTISLANNHTSNAGKSGLEYTKKVLTDNGIGHIGQQSEFNSESVKRFESGGSFDSAQDRQKLSIITVDLVSANPDITEVIKKEKQDGYFVLVFPHWGNEYQAVHSQTQENYAKDWIDSGADLVIGSHPHVIEDAEMYKGKPIFYSLGNLLFDQTFSTETQRGLVISGKITKDKLQLVLLPTASKNLKPELLRGQEKTDLIDKFREDLKIESSNKDYGYDIIEINR